MSQLMNDRESSQSDRSVIPDIVIDTPPSTGVNVDYLKETFVPVGVTNKTDNDIVVESIIIKFSTSPESDKKDDGIIRYDCPGEILKPNGHNYWKIKIVPNLFFEAYTNSYGVAVTYRKDEGGKRGAPLTFHKPVGLGNYLIIGMPPPTYGKVFISYKDDEDLELAQLLLTLAQRAGFDAYIAPPHRKPGTDIWNDKIIPAIKSSDFAFIIWTDHAEKNPGGVEKEIKLCRKSEVEEVLLLLKGIDVPELYKSNKRKGKEYMRFNRDTAALNFSEVVVARRKMIEG